MVNLPRTALLAALIALLTLTLVPVALGAVASPTNLTATVSSVSSIDLVWNDNADNETNYMVFRFNQSAQDWDVIVSLPANSITYSDTGLTAGETYRYQVIAGRLTASGDEWSDHSNEASATPQVFIIEPAIITNGPNPPKYLNASPTAATAITLSWIDNSLDESGFEVQRRPDPALPWGTVTTLPADLTFFVDSGLDPSTTYEYQVLAYNASGPSLPSNIVSATTLSDTQPPPTDNTNPAVEVVVMKFFLGSTQYTINGAVHNMDAAPIEENSRMLLPIRYVAEALGKIAVWDGASKITIQGQSIIEMWLGQNTASVDGQMVFIDPDNPNVMPITVPPGRVMVPLRFVSENMFCSALWDPSPPGSATITYPAGP